MSDEQRVKTMAGWVGVEISRSRVRTPGKAGYGLYRVRAAAERHWHVPHPKIGPDGAWTGYAYTLEQIAREVVRVIELGGPAKPCALLLHRLSVETTFVVDRVPTRWMPAYRGRRDGVLPQEASDWLADPSVGAGLSDAAMQALNRGGKLVTEGTVRGRQRAGNQAFQARHKRERDWGLAQRHGRKLSRGQRGGQGGDGSAPKT